MKTGLLPMSILLALAAGRSTQAGPSAHDDSLTAGRAATSAEQLASDFHVNFGKVFADRQTLIEKAGLVSETKSADPAKAAAINYSALSVPELALQLRARDSAAVRGAIGYWFIGHESRDGSTTASYRVTCGNRTSAAGALPAYMWSYCHVDTEPDVMPQESMFRMVREVSAQSPAVSARN